MAQQARTVNRPEGDRDLTQHPKRLRWRRVAAGLTMRQLAAKSGFSIGSISMWENGRRSADVVSLTALASALDCEITDLMPAEPAA